MTTLNSDKLHATFTLQQVLKLMTRGSADPFLLSNFWVATWIAVELAAIAWIRNRYMDTPLLGAISQVVLGWFPGVFSGFLIGNL